MLARGGREGNPILGNRWVRIALKAVVCAVLWWGIGKLSPASGWLLAGTIVALILVLLAVAFEMGRWSR